MRFACLILLVAGLVLPAEARADLQLHLPQFEQGASTAAPGDGLVGDLKVDPDLGGGAGRRGAGDVKDVLALILGIIPGFGLGHVIADSHVWTTWLIIDVVILVVFWVALPWYWTDWDGPYYRRWGWGWYPWSGLFNLLILVERILEGIDAFKRARGSSLFNTGPGPERWIPPDPLPRSPRRAELPRPMTIPLFAKQF
jgi:hypothetical protein